MKKETEYFFKMPFSIVENEDLSITDKFLFGIVFNLTNRTGTCTASNAYLADILKLSTKTIERSFKSLRDNGLIETINIYENSTKRIIRRDTKIVPSKMSNSTLNLSNSTLKNEDTLPSKMSFDTLKNEGDNKINIKEENKRDKAVATLPLSLSSNDKEEEGNLDDSNSKPKQTKKTDTSYHFDQLNKLALELKTKKDGNKHHPFKVIKEFDEYLQDYPYETQEEKEIVHEILDVGYRFIRYRDERFNLTKDKGFGLCTIKSIEQFIRVVYSDHNSIELDDLFERLEIKGWITIQKGWKL